MRRLKNFPGLSSLEILLCSSTHLHENNHRRFIFSPKGCHRTLIFDSLHVGSCARLGAFCIEPPVECEGFEPTFSFPNLYIILLKYKPHHFFVYL